jgi:hypothetical protein
LTSSEITRILVLPSGHEHRRVETVEAVLLALQIVREFAAVHGWSRHVRQPFFNAVEIYADQSALWRRILELNGVEDAPMPTDALTAALEGEKLLAVFREEAERARPEYFRTPEDWARALAHEIVHRLHARILNGNEDAMGPEWFFEGFAVYGSGQPLGDAYEIASADEGLMLAAQRGRGAYARYAAAVRFFAERVPLPELVANAGTKDFDAWLRSRVS